MPLHFDLQALANNGCMLRFGHHSSRPQLKIVISKKVFFIGDVMQLRRPRSVLGVGISGCCLFRRILWTAGLEHLAFEAMSSFSNPRVSKVSIKICVAASSGGAIIVDDTLTLAG